MHNLSLGVGDVVTAGSGHIISLERSPILSVR
jgi:hypothetical protein